MARLVGIAAAVHVGEVEAPDGAARVRVREEGADRGGGVDLEAEGVGFPVEMTEVARVVDAAFEEGMVEMVRFGRAVGGEVGQVENEAGAKVLSIRQQREQLHPARIDPGEGLVGGRGEAGDGPVEPLRRARDGDAAGGVEAEDREDLRRLRAAEEFLEAGGVFEAVLEEFGARGVGEDGSAVDPGDLLLEVEELSQAFEAASVRWIFGHSDCGKHRNHLPTCKGLHGCGFNTTLQSC